MVNDMVGHISRARVWLVLALVPMFALSGCSSPEVACPAVAYASTLKIQLIGDTELVSEVLVCGSQGCESEETSLESTQVVEAIQSRDNHELWTAPLFFLEEPLTVLATDSTGEVLFETQIGPEWVRTGGTEECGGPMSAEVAVEL